MLEFRRMLGRGQALIEAQEVGVEVVLDEVEDAQVFAENPKHLAK